MKYRIRRIGPLRQRKPMHRTDHQDVFVSTGVDLVARLGLGLGLGLGC